jgi:hypothetical protein
MAGYPTSSTKRSKVATSIRGHTAGKAGRVASKSVMNRKSKASVPPKPPEKTKIRKPGRPPSSPDRAASATRRTSNRNVGVAAQLKAISDDLQAIVSLRNEVHELQVGIKTLIQVVDRLLKRTEDERDDRSEPTEPRIVPKDPPNSEIAESEGSPTFCELGVTGPARLESTPASDH